MKQDKQFRVSWSIRHTIYTQAKDEAEAIENAEQGNYKPENERTELESGFDVIEIDNS